MRLLLQLPEISEDRFTVGAQTLPLTVKMMSVSSLANVFRDCETLHFHLRSWPFCHDVNISGHVTVLQDASQLTRQASIGMETAPAATQDFNPFARLASLATRITSDNPTPTRPATLASGFGRWLSRGSLVSRTPAAQEPTVQYSGSKTRLLRAQKSEDNRAAENQVP